MKLVSIVFWAQEQIRMDRVLKRVLILRKRTRRSLNKIMNDKDISMTTKIGRVKTILFPVIMYENEC